MRDMEDVGSVPSCHLVLSDPGQLAFPRLINAHETEPHTLQGSIETVQCNIRSSFPAGKHLYKEPVSSN